MWYKFIQKLSIGFSLPSSMNKKERLNLLLISQTGKSTTSDEIFISEEKKKKQHSI